MAAAAKRIVFLNRCYWPDSEATGQLLTDLCEYLSESFDVHVVCGQPNSPTTTEYSKSGIEERNGVTIHRLPHTRFAKRVPAGRLINLASFSLAAAAYLRRKKLPSDIVIAETDPFLLPIVAAKHAKRVNARLICYLQDIYPDVAEAIQQVVPGMLTRQLRGRLQGAYQSADRVIVLGNCMRERLVAAPWSVDEERIEVIPNWADCEKIVPLSIDDNSFRSSEGLQENFVVMHSGNMGLTQRLDVLLEATRCAVWPEEAVLLLIGDGATRPSLIEKANQFPSNRVRFLPYQPRERLSESLSAADLHVVSMHENITGCLCPSKLYGIMAVGRPILAVADPLTDLCRMVKEHQIGWCCEPGSPEQIASLVAQAASEQAVRIASGDRARTAACERFDRHVVYRQFADMIDEVSRCDSPSNANVLASA